MARSSEQPPHPESVALLRERHGTDPGTERGTMGSFFRSEEMALCQLFIQPEAAYPSVAELGEAGSVQFRDLNVDVNAFQRKFVSEVRRCDELERKLRYIEGELHKDSVPIPELENVPRAPNPREISDLEASLEKTESEILELSQNAVNLKSNFLELMELKHVLEKTESFFSEREGNGGDSIARGLIEDPSHTSHAHARLGFVAGVVPRERVPAFERMLWRISRGNVFLRQTEIEEPLEDPSTGNAIYKTVFVAFFQGEQLKTRVKKVCTGFHASLYPCPSEYNERYDMVKGVCTRLEDLNLVLNQTQDHRQRVLVSVAKELQNWMIMVRKMKAIYHTLNMFNMDVTKKCLIAECWVPVSELTSVQKALEDGGKACGSSIPSFLNVIETSEAPPTFNRANKFTKGFQNLIDSYGVSSYREVNPALYTIITFPFLFAIMFGDAGHGLILTAFGLYMVIREEQLMKQKSSSEIWNIFFAGRYIILLMGLFSMYTGIIYNDVFSKSLNIFGSSWSFGFSVQDVRGSVSLTLDPFDHYAKNNGTPYPLGLDPIWQGAENKIIFLNSYKMKLSIIFGVVHMIFGVALSVINHLHFRRAAYILLEFVPQLLFLVLLFAYMVAMMFMKWSMYYPQQTKECRIENCTEADLEIIRYGTSCAPSVLILFINMMLFKSAETPGLGCNEYMFDGQKQMQQVFVYIALLCIPALLLGKPLYIFCCKRRRSHKHHASGNGDVNQGMELTPEMTDIPNDTSGEVVHEEHEEPMGEIWIHQAIHTIEYILSTISHTASYLRLWALSLAHAQLSEVLWNMVLAFGLHPPLEGNAGSLIISGIILFAVFGAWAAFTLAILVMMEGLSAFLHTLRLHWVEFMSKFYEGAGYTFQPFSFKIILENEDAVEE